MVFTSYKLDSFDNKSQVDAIFTNFRKASDTIEHGLLLNKLEALGIGNPLISWLSNYITYRIQFVRIHDTIFKPYLVSSGVPSESHLSPLLFILSLITNIKILLFADDVKMCFRINSTKDFFILQAKPKIFCDRVKYLGLTLNIKKCIDMNFSRSHSPYYYCYYLNIILVQRVHCVNKLGIHLKY